MVSSSHAGRGVHGDEDVGAAHEHAGEILAVAFARYLANLGAAEGLLGLAQAIDILFPGIDIGLQLLHAVPLGGRLGVEFLQILQSRIAVLYLGDELAICLGHPLFGVFELLLQIDQILLAGEYLEVEPARIRQQVPVHHVGHVVDAVVDDQEHQHDGAETARHHVEERQREDVEAPAGPPRCLERH